MQRLDMVIIDDEVYNFFLNSISFTGVPDHKLKLMIEKPLLMLRNLDHSPGPCNRAKLVIMRLGQWSIDDSHQQRLESHRSQDCFLHYVDELPRYIERRSISNIHLFAMNDTPHLNMQETGFLLSSTIIYSTLNNHFTSKYLI